MNSSKRKEETRFSSRLPYLELKKIKSNLKKHFKIYGQGPTSNKLIAKYIGNVVL
jgi:hypothetical protein